MVGGERLEPWGPGYCKLASGRKAHSLGRPALHHRPSGRGDGGDSPGTHTRALGEHVEVIPVELQLGPQQVLQFL